MEAWAYPIGVNIPLGQLGGRLDELPRDVTIVVACHVGGRSATAAKALSERAGRRRTSRAVPSPGRPGSPAREVRRRAPLRGVAHPAEACGDPGTGPGAVTKPCTMAAANRKAPAA